MLFFIGSYTEAGLPFPIASGTGITSCSFDPENGTIKVIGSWFQRNPSYPIVSANGKILYAAEEMFASENPKLISYSISEDGRLHRLNEEALPASFACHLAIANQTIITANYVSGDMHIYTLEADGCIGSLLQHIQHSGSGMNKERQEAAHPHMIYVIDNRTFFCVDLGIDLVKVYSVEPSSGKWENKQALDIQVKPGAGARHMDMTTDKEKLALIGELNAELFLFQRTGNRFRLVDSALLGEKEMSAAAVKIHPNNRFIYCSERKTNSIHAFSIVDNKLQFIGSYSCAGTTPRDISIDPTGKWLLVANQDSDTIAVFSLNTDTGGLQLVHSYHMATPSCICWHSRE